MRFKRPPHPAGAPIQSALHSSRLAEARLLYPRPSSPPSSSPSPPFSPVSSMSSVLGPAVREFSVRATALLNMASDGMILTNHDHQIRVGVLTGKTAPPHVGSFPAFAHVSMDRFQPGWVWIHVCWIFFSSFFAWRRRLSVSLSLSQVFSNPVLGDDAAWIIFFYYFLFFFSPPVLPVRIISPQTHAAEAIKNVRVVHGVCVSQL